MTYSAQPTTDIANAVPHPMLPLSIAVEDYCKALLVQAENHRREKPSMDSWPLPVAKANVVDYGSSGQTIENALAHLRESIPNGQKARTEFAFKALNMAVRQHGAWLAAKGYSVTE